MRRRLLVSVITLASSVSAAAALSGAAANSAAPTRDAVPAAPKVTLLLTRTGPPNRWEYRLSVRVRAGGTGRQLSGLQVEADGVMHAPGHHMNAGPSRLQDRGAGLYQSRVAFYMPGPWRILVSVTGARVVPSVTRFDVVLK
jgi:YtkA-like protein